MNFSLRPILFLALAAGAGLVTSCGDKEGDDSAIDPAVGAARQGLAGFYDPQPGEVWAYRVQRQIPLDAKLTAVDQARKPERTDSGYLVIFERERRCVGTTTPEGAEKELTCMDIREDGARRGQELYDISAKGVFSRGWLSADKDGKSDILKNGVAVALPKMTPGNVWEGVGDDPNRRFLFRIIERAKVDVPAGKFDTSRIQITSNYEGRSLKRTIWFAENVGIVKEESVYYGPQRTRIRERAELIRWNVPRPGDVPEEESTSEETLPDQDQPESGGEPTEDESSERSVPAGEETGGTPEGEEADPEGGDEESPGEPEPAQD